jgi:predicted O-methyltransferase YrrM
MPVSSKDLRTKYIEQLYAVETPEIVTARENIAAHDFPIHISPAEGRLLQLIIKMAGVKSIVEIGTLGGYSALWLADALPADGHLYTLEHDEKRQKLAKDGLSNRENITLIPGDAKETLPALSEKHGAFDMVFIDADKKSYLEYLDWADTGIRKGGLIIADDTLLEGAVYLDELPGRVRRTTRDTLRAFNERLADRSRYDSLLWPTDAGLTIAIKAF